MTNTVKKLMFGLCLLLNIQLHYKTSEVVNINYIIELKQYFALQFKEITHKLQYFIEMIYILKSFKTYRTSNKLIKH